MPCRCPEYVCLTVSYDACSSGVELPVVADETGLWSVEIEFNGTWIRLSVAVSIGEPIVIPNVLNEHYVHTIRILNSEKQLFNDRCYKLQK
jgi:hypothetical protein